MASISIQRHTNGEQAAHSGGVRLSAFVAALAAAARVLVYAVRRPSTARSLELVAESPVVTSNAPASSKLKPKSRVLVGLAALTAATVGALAAPQLASATVTWTPTSNTSISADTAANATTPAWTTMTVTLNAAAADFSVAGQIVITPPTNWAFNTTGASATETDANGQLVIGTVTSTATAVTYPWTISKTNKTVTLQLVFQIRPIAGGTFPATGNVVVDAASSGLPTGVAVGSTMASVGMVAGAVKKLGVSTASPATAGVGQNITTTAQDQFGNTVTTYAGSKNVTFSGASNAPNGSVPTVTNASNTAINFGTATAITFTAGVATRTLTLYSTAAANIVATESTNVSPALAVSTNAAALANFALTIGTPQQVGVAFSSGTLTARDAYNNTITGFSALADPVTFSAPLSGSVAGLAGAGNVLNRVSDFVNGVANLATLGAKYVGATGAGTFTATSSTSKTGTSASVTLNVGPVTHFLVSAASNSPLVGAADQLTITAKDAGNNTVTTYTGSKNLTFSGANASPNANNPTVTNASGTAIAFGSTTAVTFTNGISSAGGSMKLYKA